MMPAHLRPVNLPSYRPSYSHSYVPPPLVQEGSKLVLGQTKVDLGHVLEQLPESLVIGGLGATAVYAGDILPSPVDVISKVLGVSAFAYAVYQLLGNPPPPIPQGGTNKTEAGKGVPPGTLPYRPDELQVELDVKQVNRGGLQRGVIFTYLPGFLGGSSGQQCFDFLLRNNTDKEIQLFAGLRVEDSDGSLIWRSYPNVNQGWFGRWLYKIPADPAGVKNKVEATRCIDTVFWFKETFISVELFRNAEDGLPFKTSAPIEIIWGPLA